MRASRKQLINVTCKEGLRKRVDQFLASQYQAWKQLKQPRRDIAGFFSCGSQNSNALIMDYVRSIYNDYNIPDPMQKNIQLGSPLESLRSSNKQGIIYSQTRNLSERSQKNSPIMNQSPINLTYQSPRPKQVKYTLEQTPKRRTNETHSQTVPKEYKLNIPQHQMLQPTHHKRDHSQIIDRGTAHTVERTDALKSSKQLQISGGRKISKESQQHIDHGISIQLYKESDIKKDQVSSTYTPKQTKNFEKTNYFKFSRKINKMNNVKQTEEFVPETYRYCLACEKPVLDANVQIHEKVCQQFGKIYQFDLEGILKHLTEKVQMLRQKVKNHSNKLQSQDTNMIRKMCQNLDQQCPQIVKNGRLSLKFVSNYDSAIKVGRKWCETTQQINKLRWFLRVREEIKNHFNV